VHNSNLHEYIWEVSSFLFIFLIHCFFHLLCELADTGEDVLHDACVFKFLLCKLDEVYETLRWRLNLVTIVTL
jgi:hypothetical protein